jgi:hypothetical protein
MLHPYAADDGRKLLGFQNMSRLESTVAQIATETLHFSNPRRSDALHRFSAYNIAVSAPIPYLHMYYRSNG